MMNVSSNEFKRQMGTYLGGMRDGPIQIEKSGRPIAVVLSPDEYAYLQGLEEQYWIARADAAATSGEWIEHDEAFKRIASRLGEAE